MLQFTRASKAQSRLRLAIIGPAGSGKTYTALSIAKGLGGKIAFVDTERGSAAKYAGDVAEFDTLNLELFSPANYIDAIKSAEAAGYDVLIIDSLSHAWFGKGGALEMVDNAAKRSGSGNSFTAWRDVTPQHNALVDTILQSRCHIIVGLRAKTEYVMEENIRGQKVPKKIGLAPIQRDGLEYEFDLVGMMTDSHDFIVSKSRCAALADAVIAKPGAELAATLKAWLTDGAKVELPNASTPPTPQSTPSATSTKTSAGGSAKTTTSSKTPTQTSASGPSAAAQAPAQPAPAAPATPAAAAAPQAAKPAPAPAAKANAGDPLAPLAAAASKRVGPDTVRAAIKAITGGTLAMCKPEQRQALETKLKELANAK